MAELRRRFDEAQLLADQEASHCGDDPDYIAISRKVPAKKGKRRIVWKVEVAEARF